DGFRENALPLQQRRNGRDHRATDVLPLTLIVHEEERAIADERPAERPARLVPAIVRLDGIHRLEEVPRVERFIPEELESCPVPCVGAALRRQVDDAAVEAAEFGGRTVALDLELLNRVDDREERNLTRLGLQDRDAVEQILVRPWSSAVDSRQLRIRRQG